MQSEEEEEEEERIECDWVWLSVIEWTRTAHELTIKKHLTHFGFCFGEINTAKMKNKNNN